MPVMVPAPPNVIDDLGHVGGVPDGHAVGGRGYGR
jgi:hypothetical protein